MMSLTDTQKWQLLVLTGGVGVLLYLLAPVLSPFALSALLAYLADPLVDRLQKWKLSRTLAVCVVFVMMTLVLIAVILILVPMLEQQISKFVHNLPTYATWFRVKVLPVIQQRTGLSVSDFDPQNLIDILQNHWKTAGGVAATVVSVVSKSGLAMLGWIANILLIPVVTFYLMRDWNLLLSRIHELLPRPIEPLVIKLAAESDQVLGGFLRGQLSVMIALGIIYSLGLWIVGVDLALLIGMTAGMISFVPYLGGIVGLLAAVIAALVQYHDINHVLMVLGVFAFGQTLEGMVLTPSLVGDRIGLHPVAVIFAVLTGGQIFGFLGVLLALPVASVAMVLLRYVHSQYVTSHLYGAEPLAPTSVAVESAATVSIQTNEQSIAPPIINIEDSKTSFNKSS